MVDKRKYFDYELAYRGLERARELFNNGGIEELVNDDEFSISGGGIDYVGTIEQWKGCGYIPINASAYNITIYATIKNNRNKDIYISSELDIYSYGGGNDYLDIEEISCIEERIEGLKDYAKKNDYTDEDYNEELKSLQSLLTILKSKNDEKYKGNVDKYYQNMIDEILNGASDREQLEIILKLVVGLKEWNTNGNAVDYVIGLYYEGLSQIETEIKEIMRKEDEYND